MGAGGPAGKGGDAVGVAGRVRRVMAIDPGRAKCGVAVVEPGGGVLHREVVATADLERRVVVLLARYAPDVLVVGDRTGSGPIARRLGALSEVRALGGVVAVDERDSSLEARRRYFQAMPPRGLWRLVPAGLRVPPVPVDDWAAVVLAERFLSSHGGGGAG